MHTINAIRRGSLRLGLVVPVALGSVLIAGCAGGSNSASHSAKGTPKRGGTLQFAASQEPQHQSAWNCH